MARGQAEKESTIAKILEVFPGSFAVDGKEVRIPVGDLQVKCVFSVAKENITVTATPTPAAVMADDGFPAPVSTVPPEGLPWDEPAANEPTPQEVENTRKIIAALGL